MRKKIKLAEASNLQSKFKYEKSDIKEGNETRTNVSITDNFRSLFNAREKVLKWYNDYAELTGETKSRSLQGKEIKILNPKHMFQRFPIVLA